MFIIYTNVHAFKYSMCITFIFLYDHKDSSYYHSRYILKGHTCCAKTHKKYMQRHKPVMQCCLYIFSFSMSSLHSSEQINKGSYGQMAFSSEEDQRINSMPQSTPTHRFCVCLWLLCVWNADGRPLWTICTILRKCNRLFLFFETQRTQDVLTIICSH